MKQKHNKKRNTAFLYEALTRELTISILENNSERQKKTTSILKEFFKKDEALSAELGLYQNLTDVDSLSAHTADKLIQETRFLHSRLDKRQIFNEQTRLISKINKELSKDIFSYFVPNYKSLATIYQIFNSPLGSKERVLLEEGLLNAITKDKVEVEGEKNQPIDNVVYKAFVKKFNEEYNTKLSDEQRNLLERYIFSFVDNGLEFKIFLNEELSRLKGEVKTSRTTPEMVEDSEMIAKTDKVLEILEEYKTRDVTSTQDLMKILKIQELVREIQE
tara:strand:+ start:1130 stop:1957 length:828 start_codon:yes stop_codon:yes gene_type:complete